MVRGVRSVGNGKKRLYIRAGFDDYPIAKRGRVGTKAQGRQAACPHAVAAARVSFCIGLGIASRQPEARLFDWM